MQPCVFSRPAQRSLPVGMVVSAEVCHDTQWSVLSFHLLYQDTDGETELSFMFQKTKYVYNTDRKLFHDVEFPVQECFSFYQSATGIDGGNESQKLECVQHTYGTNK